MESKKIKTKLLLATRGNENSNNGLLTFLCDIPYYIHSEITRHKRFCYSVSSARAQSSNKHIENGFYLPEIFYKDIPGMQSSNKPIEEQETARLIYKDIWEECEEAIRRLSLLGVCKEQKNRLLPTNKMVKMVMTGTENAYKKMLFLRNNPSADKAIQDFAKRIQNDINDCDWNYSDEHIPMIKPDETFLNKRSKVLTAIARIARTSYDKPKEGQNDLELAERLLQMNHLSPSEHIAFYSKSYNPSVVCSKKDDIWNGWSWSNYRSLIEKE